MTTWYKARDPDGQPLQAFSVRPDIWSPGTVVDTIPMAHARHWLAIWTQISRAVMPLQEYEAPGAAEALVLGGRVAVGPSGQHRTHLAWTEGRP